MGKIILIDGIDGCGKSTQVQMLVDHLKSLGKNVVTKHFPNYESDSSAPVRMYLNGELGDDTNPIATALMFAVDRYITFKRELKSLYNDPNTYIILDRWTLTTQIYQSIQLKDWMGNPEHFIHLIYTIEHSLLMLPEPSITIILNIDADFASNLILERAKAKGIEKDIHEKDTDFLKLCAENYRLRAVKDRNTTMITVTYNDDNNCIKMRTPEDIHSEIVKSISHILIDKEK